MSVSLVKVDTRTVPVVYTDLHLTGIRVPVSCPCGSRQVFGFGFKADDVTPALECTDCGEDVTVAPSDLRAGQSLLITSTVAGRAYIAGLTHPKGA